jgi:hypothetical protein
MIAKGKVKLVLLVIVVIMLTACKSMEPRPSMSLGDVNFVIFPRVLEHDGKYYLNYQVDTSRDPVVRMLIGQAEQNGRLYFYIEGKTSFPEYKHPVERPIEVPEAGKYITQNAIYWLNADGSETQLKIEKK